MSEGAGRAQPGGPAGGAVCIANISPHERGMRFVAGAILFLISLVALAVLAAAGVDRWWRVALLPLSWGAAVGFFQWHDTT